MNSINAGFGFLSLGIFANYLNVPKTIIYGSYLCSIAGVLNHSYGFRNLDIVVVITTTIVNIIYSYINNYLDNTSILFALIGTLNYLNKTEHHALLVQVPFFISILNMIFVVRSQRELNSCCRIQSPKC